MFLIIVVILITELCYIECKESRQKSQKSLCSRKHSKFIREYFARALLPIYQKYNLPVPEKCPFSPLHDIYHLQENNKTKLDVYKWKCEICGKYFTSEEYLDKHFSNKHNDSLQKNKHSICLANNCRIFRCDVLLKSSSVRPKCYESSMINLKNRCIANLDLCVPTGTSLSVRNKITADLRENLCSYLTCSKYYDLPNYMTSGPSFITIFLIVLVAGFCVVSYGIINHTDLIFDENEITKSLECDNELSKDYSNIPDMSEQTLSNQILSKNYMKGNANNYQSESHRNLRQRYNIQNR